MPIEPIFIDWEVLSALDLAIYAERERIIADVFGPPEISPDNSPPGESHPQSQVTDQYGSQPGEESKNDLRTVTQREN